MPASPAGRPVLTRRSLMRSSDRSRQAIRLRTTPSAVLACFSGIGWLLQSGEEEKEPERL